MTTADKLIRAKTDYDKVYEAGKKAEYDAFWGEFQENGNRKNYEYAFASIGWTEKNMKAKYPIQPTSPQRMFQNNRLTGDLTEFMTIDFSKATSLAYIFGYSYYITRIGEINTTSASALEGTFFYAREVVTIDKIILKADGSQTFNNTFTQCYQLTNVVIEGIIGKTISFSDSSKLSKASITSIINALSSAVTGQTATFKKTAKEAAFTADEWAALIATKPNWTISLA